MATTDELLVVQAEDGVVRVQEVRVEDDFDTVGSVVEELHAPDLVQNRVVVVVCHIVCRDRWQSVTLEGKDTTLEENFVFVGQQLVWCGQNTMITVKITSAVTHNTVNDLTRTHWSE